MELKINASTNDVVTGHEKPENLFVYFIAPFLVVSYLSAVMVLKLVTRKFQ